MQLYAPKIKDLRAKMPHMGLIFISHEEAVFSRISVHMILILYNNSKKLLHF